MIEDLRTQPDSVLDFAEQLLEVSDKMMKEGSPYAVDVRAIANCIYEGLARENNETKG